MSDHLTNGYMKARLADEANVFPDRDEMGRAPATHIKGVHALKRAKYRPSLLPVEATLAGVLAMEFGVGKHGLDSWKKPEYERVEFIDALERHLIALKQGEKFANDSGVHHLGHIIANCAILLAKFEPVLSVPPVGEK